MGRPQARKLEENYLESTIILQKHGAPPHFSRYGVEVLTKHFLEDGLACVVQFCGHLGALI
jgi:hypothetical protein